MLYFVVYSIILRPSPISTLVPYTTLFRSGAVTTPGQVGVATAGSFAGEHVFTAAGTYTVTVAGNDDGSRVNWGTLLVTVDWKQKSLTVASNQIVNEGALL